MSEDCRREELLSLQSELKKMEERCEVWININEERDTAFKEMHNDLIELLDKLREFIFIPPFAKYVQTLREKWTKI